MGGNRTGSEFEVAVTSQTKFLYLSNPNNPTGAVLSEAAMKRIVERCEQTGTWLLADEVYLGAEIDRPRTRSFWGMSDRVLVTSGLSKAYGIPGVRIGWIVGPPTLVADCWSQHDYLTIGPNKLSDRIARIAVEPENRDKCYAARARSSDRTCRSRATWVDELRRPADVARAGRRGHRAPEVQRGHAQRGDRRARAHEPEHAHRPRHPTSASRGTFACGWAARKTSCVRG